MTPSAARPSADRRRSPRYSRFIIAGAMVGLVLGVLAALAFQGTTYTLAVAIIAGVALSGLGALLGGLVAVLLDRRT